MKSGRKKRGKKEYSNIYLSQLSEMEKESKI
jgi:hypothetical protein